MDKRHERRLKIVQELYAITFPNTLTRQHLSDRTKEVLKHADAFDVQIQEVAQKYTVDKIARVDISILRNALYELTIERKVPPKVIINEAVELAKELGSEKSPSFVNAVLGKIYEAETSSTHEKLQDSQIPTE
jgi:N utilization substance protein B